MTGGLAARDADAGRALAEQPTAVPDDLFTAIAAGDADEGVRAAALMALQRRAGASSEVKAFLTRRAAEDPSANLRHLAEQLLAR